MAQPFGHVDAPALIGSWPIVPQFVSGTPTISPRTLLTQATIISVKREDASGFDVDGRSFFIDVDGTPVSVSFVGTPLTLDDVITQINSAAAGPVGADIAFRDNGFLRLESPTQGENSTLRLRTDPASTPTDVFFELGLFSETTSKGGDLTGAGNIDPTRQVSLPGQLSVAKGETLSDDIFNRSVLQLALNSDRAYGLLDRKKLAETVEIEVVNPSDGFTIADLVYTGSVVTPTEDELEDVVTLLRSDGSELVQETEASTAGTADFATLADSNAQRVTATAGLVFQASDDSGDVYVRSSAAGMGALQNKLLKIVKFEDASNVIVRNVNPDDGVVVPINDTGFATERVVITTEAVRVTGLYESAAKLSRIEQDTSAKDSGAVDRIERNNRVVVPGATFSTNGVIPGDLVTYAGHSITYPYTNNGTYRVLSVIDEETLELQSEDYGSVILIPTGALGTVSVAADGDFYENPFVELNTTVEAGTYKVLYKKQSNLRTILDAVDGLATGFHKFAQEADDVVQKALLAAIGPSAEATGLAAFIHDDRRINLESHEYRIDKEHYDYEDVGPDGNAGHAGRHQNIRPDTIDFFPGLAGTRLTMRDTSDVVRFTMDDEGASTWVNTLLTLTNTDLLQTDGVSTFNESRLAIFSSVGTARTLNIDPTSSVVNFADSIIESIVNGDSYWRIAADVGAPAGSTTGIEIDSRGTGGLATLNLRGASSGFTGAEIGTGATSFGMIADSEAANPQSWVLSTQPGAAVGGGSPFSGIMKWDIADDGSGTTYANVFGMDVDGEIFMNKLPERYGSAPATLQIGRTAARWALVMDGLDANAVDVLFRHANSVPVADQNNTNIIAYTDGRYVTRSLDDTYNERFPFSVYDLSDGQLGFRMNTVTKKFPDALSANTEHLASHFEGSVVLGGHSTFALTDIGGGAGPGDWPADADVAGTKLAFLEAVSSYLTTIQDGSGRVNRYWNAFNDGGGGGNAGGHRYVRFEEPAIRENWETTGDISWQLAGPAVANGDPVSWIPALNLYNNDRSYPTVDMIGDMVYNRTSTDGGISSGRLARGVRLGGDSRSVHASTFEQTSLIPLMPAGGVEQTSVSLNPEVMCLAGRYLWTFRYSNTGNFLQWERLDTSNWPSSSGLNATSTLGTDDRTVEAARYMESSDGRLKFIVVKFFNTTQNRPQLLKLNITDVENPVSEGFVDVGAPPATTSWTGSCGLFTDTQYAYLVAFNNGGAGTPTAYAAKFNINPDSTAAPTLVGVVASGITNVGFSANHYKREYLGCVNGTNLVFGYYNSATDEQRFGYFNPNFNSGSSPVWTGSALFRSATGNLPDIVVMGNGIEGWAATRSDTTGGSTLVIGSLRGNLTTSFLVSGTLAGGIRGAYYDDEALYINLDGQPGSVSIDIKSPIGSRSDTFNVGDSIPGNAFAGDASWIFGYAGTAVYRIQRTARGEI